MSIADQINRLNNAKANIKQAIENKGVIVSDSALLDEYPALISSIPMEGGDPYYEDLYNMRTSNGTNMAGMFARTSGELDLRRLDVSNVTDMKYMFDNSLASVNIDGWDTSNVINMYYMFNFFIGSIDISKLDTSNVANANYMFSNANTDNIILTGLSFPKCTKLDNMFYNAKGTTLDLSSWDISNITNMGYMFAGEFKKIDLTGWKTTNVTNMSSMFYKYSNPLVELIIPDWDMTSYSGNIFYNSSYITNLKLIDLSRSNDATITKIASYLPTRTATTYGKVIVPYDTSQATYDALIAKYWAPIGAALSPVPTNYSIVAELDEIYPGKSTKVYLGDYEPWNADTNKVELVISDSSIATMTEDNEVISTGVLGDIVLEVRIKDTQEIVETKTIVVSETDSYPNVINWRGTNKPTANNYIYVNGTDSSNKVLLSNVNYDATFDLYTYDAGEPITYVKFNGFNNTGNTYANTCTEVVKINTSNITNMGEMFYGCNKLTSLDVSNFDTSNVTNMDSMFSSCDNLQSLDLSNFNTSNVTIMSDMFWGCKSLTSLDLSNWDTSNVTDMSNMFRLCPLLTTLNLSNWDTGNVTSMDSMFLESYALTELDLSNWDTSNVTKMGNMFSNCESLAILDLSNFYIGNNTNVGYMFQNCTSLHTLRLDNCNNDTIRKIITSYKFPTNAIEGVTKTIYCKEENAAGLTPPTNWVFSYVVEEPEVPVDPPVEDIPLYVVGEFKEDDMAYDEGTIPRKTEVKTMVNETHTDLERMFGSCHNLVSVNTQDWDVSNVTNMSYMFQGCYSLQVLDVNEWDTGKVTNMDGMFGQCYNLQSLDLSNWDTRNVNSVNSMFANCESLTELNLSNWDLSSIGTSLDEESAMNSMLGFCTSLRTLRLDNCSNDTIRKIINSDWFPTDNGGTIHCKEENAAGLSAPTNWVFSYVD